MARVTFTGVDLQDFVSPSFDDHVKLFFPSDPSQPLVLPSVTPDGIKFPDDALRPQARDYTPRYFDAARQELVIDFVMHGDGPAADLGRARSARPGAGHRRPARFLRGADGLRLACADRRRDRLCPRSPGGSRNCPRPRGSSR